MSKHTATARPSKGAQLASAPAAAAAPQQAGLVLATLIIVAAVANLPLAMANVALPTIGAYFDASQVQLNLVAVGYSLGLACSVLWLGALGDRYGRKQIALLGVILAMPAALISGLAPTIEVLIFGRLFGGFAAGMAYPTTLALIAALWGPGPGRTKAIALWSAIGGAISVFGPLVSGALLEVTTWPWVFWIVIPLAVAALLLVLRFIPAHVNEGTEPVDNLGGIISVILVGTFVLALNFLPVSGYQQAALALLAIAALALILFVLRQRRAENPLYDLKVARRPTFWVAAVAGIVIFGSLMGAMFIGQQYLQDVLGYNTIQAALPALFAGAFMILAAPRSATLVETRGARWVMLRGYLFIFLGFLAMLLLWKENASFLVVALAYALVGVGIGLSGTPASRSLTGSAPVTRVGMASGTADLQRDLGGAIFNSLFGALLAAGYAAAIAAQLATTADATQIPASVTSSLEMSYAGAQAVAAQYPQYASQITAAAKTAFLAGDQYAYLAGIGAVLLGAALVFFFFPKSDRERELLQTYHEEDMEAAAAA
ncbi:MAG TPA: MFS transporter [Anaerolineae bacterium]|nr:MFS transporter [Anaerolineae bacterium]HNU04539.1 MFS transporter [Anaerolineae bacterium]